jgi:hypothetical protein
MVDSPGKRQDWQKTSNEYTTTGLVLTFGCWAMQDVSFHRSRNQFRLSVGNRQSAVGIQR